ncbi:tetratricopeptide repeat protein [Bradyrhizobium sp. CCGUVB1N3]|uniref:tetratricopeptide repeat protein n=1 Tax=Bradyrhizobium sp. CCGUVB1N3 TaxID=2949629 RepID=UPI0020B2D4F5|nr:tetratricopeptide repeat protein [Bradyrhizobium sp. CCGUVB1N3]MCP3469528.1 tetratricopeptide repeat protein [Bradyrhizobium sp. CCGUVB1N3]
MKGQTREAARAEAMVALLNRGNHMMDQGKLAKAIEAYRELITLAPQFGPGHRNLALALEQVGELAEALSVCRHAVEIQPDDLEAYLIMASLLLKLERTDQAVTMYQLAALAAPGRSDVQASLAAALTRQGRLDEASAACQKAIELSPQNVGAYVNLGIIHSKRDDFEGAVDIYRKAISIDPNSPEVSTNLGVALSNLGMSQAAIATSRRAIELRPGDPMLHYNHAMLLLLAGDLKAGFREFEWRHSHPAPRFRPGAFDVPRWRGECRNGRTLLIHAEQGLGDTLHFARFVPAAAATGGPVVLQAQPQLVELLRDSLDVTVISRDEPAPPFDLHVPLMSLAYELGTSIETIPAERPYLKAAPAKVAAWQRRLAKFSGLKVGVVWAGNPGHLHDRKRSLLGEVLLPNLLIPGIQLFSLQKEARTSDRPVLEQLKDRVVDLEPLLTNFAETAAAASVMDLVITVDTAVAHMAGALGKPTWILLPHILDWRWFYEQEDSPWYPTVRLFRQHRPGDWESVLNRLPRELERHAADVRPPAEPQKAIRQV